MMVLEFRCEHASCG